MTFPIDEDKVKNLVEIITREVLIAMQEQEHSKSEQRW